MCGFKVYVKFFNWILLCIWIISGLLDGWFLVLYILVIVFLFVVFVVSL